KTVQILDELELPRPCIDMATVGYNVEWSQELKLEQSLEEYVKAAMLIRVLQAAGVTGGPADHEPVLFDMSVGYDLKGIQQPRVRAFIEGMLDASATIERLRPELPAEYRDLDFQPKLSDTLTLSTFHGCPPDEIERIIEHLFEAHGLNCIVKLNPTLLGPEALRGLLHDRLGYHEVQVPDAAFEKDAHWQQALDFVGRLGAKADALGLGFGVKFTNTLIVKNHRGFFPATEAEMYLSGPPLHVLAMHLVQRLRAELGDRFPISFSAGIDKQNFADAVALGLTPVTVCSDLLKAGGYGRAPAYLEALAARMRAVGAPDIDQYIIRAYGLGQAALDGVALPPAQRALCETALNTGGDLRTAAGEHFPAWVSAARLHNTAHYVPGTADDPRYAQAKNAKPPRKVGSHLALFDCLTCDKCVPVCPNAANFTLDGPATLPRQVLARTASGWQVVEEGAVALSKKHQIANYADFCNECGN
ncbi:MAG: glutamate synthase, partial [Myxococcales bacterium]|nr:glutamate synthase [Myxococcales bacterium]